MPEQSTGRTVRPRTGPSGKFGVVTMEAVPKRARAGGGEAPDRLSALLDELLHRVFSFLPSQQAVQTTVLSKRWIDLWRSMPAINLNIKEFECRSPAPGQYEKTRWGKMENFTTNLLMRHKAPRLDAFRLSTGSIRVDWRRDVDRWIRRAIEYCPVKLHIRLPVRLGVPYQLPKPFSCHLKRLVLLVCLWSTFSVSSSDLSAQS